MLFDSYSIWPITNMSPLVGTVQIAEVMIAALGELLTVAIKIAAPFVILMLAVELALGFLSRFAPQLNVFFISLPLKVLLVAALLLVYAAMSATNLTLMPQQDVVRAMEEFQRAIDGR
jgi:type III secretion protein T